jgi:5-methyltetrahydropteroyltriglutamate--homocysteine methyltransferase
MARILTTHAGALPRPDELAADADQSQAVADIVQRQIACGVDIPNDGEIGKPNFVQYVSARIAGFEERELGPGEEHPSWSVVRREESVVGDYFRRRGGVFVRGSPAASGRLTTRVTTCRGPLAYTGQAALPLAEGAALASQELWS